MKLGGFWNSYKVTFCKRLKQYTFANSDVNKVQNKSIFINYF